MPCLRVIRENKVRHERIESVMDFSPCGLRLGLPRGFLNQELGLEGRRNWRAWRFAECSKVCDGGVGVRGSVPRCHCVTVPYTEVTKVPYTRCPDFGRVFTRNGYTELLSRELRGQIPLPLLANSPAFLPSNQKGAAWLVASWTLLCYVWTAVC